MKGWEQKMDSSNFWDWNTEDEHRVSAVYMDTEDETQCNVTQNEVKQNTGVDNPIQGKEIHNESTGQTKDTPPEIVPENNFILIDNPFPPAQDTNAQNDTAFTQPQNQQPQNQKTQNQQPQFQQSGFQQIIPVQNAQQNQGTNRQNAGSSAGYRARFDSKDISENKVSAMAAYLLGPIGIIIALLLARDSAYTAFHVREALKLTVCSVVLEIMAAIFALFGMIPFVGIIFKMIFVIISAVWLSVVVLRLVAIAQVCDGEAREPVIIGKMNCFH